jgi:hypothetical protein
MIPKNEVNPRFHGLSLFLIVGEVQDSLPRLNDDSPKEANSNLLRWQSVLIFCLVKRYQKPLEHLFFPQSVKNNCWLCLDNSSDVHSKRFQTFSTQKTLICAKT